MGMWQVWERRVYRSLVGKHEGNKPLGKQDRWDAIKMDPKEIQWEGVDSAHGQAASS